MTKLWRCYKLIIQTHERKFNIDLVKSCYGALHFFGIVIKFMKFNGVEASDAEINIFVALVKAGGYHMYLTLLDNCHS